MGSAVKWVFCALFGPAPGQTTEPPGHKPLVVNVVVIDPFEEEEEGTGIASDVVKVEGEDLATQGDYLRYVDTRNPRVRNDSAMPASG